MLTYFMYAPLFCQFLPCLAVKNTTEIVIIYNLVIGVFFSLCSVKNCLKMLTYFMYAPLFCQFLPCLAVKNTTEIVIIYNRVIGVFFSLQHILVFFNSLLTPFQNYAYIQNECFSKVENGLNHLQNIHSHGLFEVILCYGVCYLLF